MKKIDLKQGLDLVNINQEEWAIVDENGKTIGNMKESSNIKAFKKTNSILFNNQALAGSTKYQFELVNCSSNCYNNGDKRDEFCVVTIDFGKYPMVQLLQTGDRMIVFKMTENGFVLIRESASDKKEIMFKTYADEKGNLESKHYIIKGTQPTEFKTRYSQKKLNSMYPEVDYTFYNSRMEFVTTKKLPMGIEAAINSNSIGKTIFQRAIQELNDALPFKENIVVSLLKNGEVPQEIMVLIPELKEKAKVKKKC